jgi:hypothetical protein
MLDDLVGTVRVYNGPVWPTRQVLELACAAQRENQKYIKTDEYVLDSEDVTKVLYVRHPNKTLMLVTINPQYYPTGQEHQPMPLKITDADVSQADAIVKHYKKLMFAAISGENEFQTTVNSLLNGETIGENMFGYIACLPSLHFKDAMFTNVKRKSKVVEEGYLADVGSWVLDLDCEILEVLKSKNFEGYNVCATIGNKMVSWISKNNLATGPCVIVKAKVKDHSKHWKHGNDVTRLNYVKAAQ